MIRVALWTLVIMSFLGCKSDDEESKNSIIVAITSTPSTMDPRFATDAQGMRISHLIFSPLVRIGPKLEIIGDAAKSWTYENLVYRFQLKENIKFSDGTPLSKEDILFTFDEYRKDSNPFHLSLKPISQVNVETNGKSFIVELKLHHFTADLLTSLTVIKLLPKKIVEKLGDDFYKNLIGTGSFKLKSNQSHQIHLERVDNHWSQTAKSKSVIFKVIKDDSTRYLKALKGSVDVCQSALPLSKIASLRKEEKLRVTEYPGLNMSYMLLNLRHEKLKVPKFRKALAMAINKKEIIDFKLDGLASPAASVLTDINPFQAKDLNPPSYNPTEAKKIIEELGLSGSEFVFKTSNNKEVVEIAKVLANQMQKIGIKFKIQSYEWGTFYKDVRSGNFEISTMQWVGVIDPDIYRTTFHSNQFPPGRNRGFYQNKTLDPLLDQGILISEFDKRKRHYHKIQHMVLADLPTIPLWYKTQVAVVHKRIKGYTPPSNGDYSYLLNVYKD